MLNPGPHGAFATALPPWFKGRKGPEGEKTRGQAYTCRDDGCGQPPQVTLEGTGDRLEDKDWVEC